MLRKPSLNFLGLVSHVVVAKNVHVEVDGNGRINFLEETQELLGAMARHGFPDHLTGLHLCHAVRFGCDEKKDFCRGAAGTIRQGHKTQARRAKVRIPARTPG